MDSKLMLKFLDLMGLIVFTANRHQVAAAALWLRSALWCLLHRHDMIEKTG